VIEHLLCMCEVLSSQIPLPSKSRGPLHAPWKKEKPMWTGAGKLPKEAPSASCSTLSLRWRLASQQIPVFFCPLVFQGFFKCDFLTWICPTPSLETRSVSRLHKLDALGHCFHLRSFIGSPLASGLATLLRWF
jgi:hypothetical protein